MSQVREQLDRAFAMEGRVAVITGGASGIGEATAQVLAAAGAAIVVGDIDEAGAERTVKSIEADGGRAVAQRVDVRSKAEVEGLVQRAVDEYGQVDFVANIAGIAAEGPAEDITEEELDRLLAINLKGTLFGVQAAIAAMKPRGTGSIVNVASASIDVAAPGYSLYAMTKAAITQLTMNVAWEVGRHGIRINTIAPGATVTPFTARHAYDDEGNVDPARMDQFVERMRNISPLRQVGEAVDQAYLLLYLASDASRFCTGQVWRANGGQAIVR
ncbi:SDR family NAD(P)-dependent oxidoreductase [Nitriliruptor alkaliphilus]|uniref:SDR family NAD(P)-dependent oxidoreductase n=1 Tax=Nitriliruptor alkaliphilus TaxID=427918 RepID=UPI00147078FA|nr:SDR family oxidoreductase [Nitriliruptor alkaliphilus]